MPALAQPSRDFRYPAPAEVNWCMLSVILRVAAPALSAATTRAACRRVRRASITNTIPLSRGTLAEFVFIPQAAAHHVRFIITNGGASRGGNHFWRTTRLTGMEFEDDDLTNFEA